MSGCTSGPLVSRLDEVDESQASEHFALPPSATSAREQLRSIGDVALVSAKIHA